MSRRIVIFSCAASFVAGVLATSLWFSMAGGAGQGSSGLGLSAPASKWASRAESGPDGNNDRQDRMAKDDRFVIVRGKEIEASELDVREIADLQRLACDGDGNAAYKLADLNTYSERDYIAAYYWTLKAFELGHPHASLKLIGMQEANFRAQLYSESLHEVPTSAKATRRLMMQVMVPPAVVPAESMQQRIERIQRLARQGGLSPDQLEIAWANNKQTSEIMAKPVAELPQQEMSLWTLLLESAESARVRMTMDSGKVTIVGALPGHVDIDLLPPPPPGDE